MEVTYAIFAFNGIAVRNFKSFPGDAWGRTARWLDNETQQPISSKEARRRFEAGEKVLYTSKGYAAYVTFDANGRTPTRSR